jgi:fumarate reductase subunit D
MVKDDLNIYDKIKELKEDLETVDLWLTVAADNGVFSYSYNYIYYIDAEDSPQQDSKKIKVKAITDDKGIDKVKFILRSEEGQPKKDEVEKDLNEGEALYEFMFSEYTTYTLTLMFKSKGITRATRKCYITIKKDSGQTDLKYEVLYDEPKSFHEAQRRLKHIFNELYTKDVSKIDIGCCETELSMINKFYHDKIKEKSIRWRLFRVYAIHIPIVLIALGILATLIMFNKNWINIYQILDIPDTVIGNINLGKLSIYAYIGFIAGIIRGLFNIAHATQMRVYRKTADIMYFSGPFISTAFAVIIVFAVYAGLVQPSAVQSTQAQQQTQQSTQTQQERQPLGAYILAFASGLFWQEAINKLAKIFNVTKSYTEKDGRIVRLD